MFWADCYKGKIAAPPFSVVLGYCELQPGSTPSVVKTNFAKTQAVNPLQSIRLHWSTGKILPGQHGR
jgi:hypothetical protein